jgi:hypothetical protein
MMGLVEANLIKMGGGDVLAVCCASAQNRIKIHESGFLYLANCISSPDNRDFFA